MTALNLEVVMGMDLYGNGVVQAFSEGGTVFASADTSFNSVGYLEQNIYLYEISGTELLTKNIQINKEIIINSDFYTESNFLANKYMRISVNG